jgi:predicted dithiol-disulfide oxidoreductase (DUF899 family)
MTTRSPSSDTAIERAPNVPHRVATRQEWLRARLALLEREKAHTRERDELALLRRELPWVRVDKPYRFVGPHGTRTLLDLFGERSQLLVYHFMFGADWDAGCPSCAMLADHVDGARVHLAARDVAFAAVSRAPYPQLAAFRARMGWRFPWFSAHASDFNPDFHVSATDEDREKGEFHYNYRTVEHTVDELHGISAFARDPAGSVYHTYSTYARGAEGVVGTYAWLDLAPRGRDDDGLDFPMAWVRHHDRYEGG